MFHECEVPAVYRLPTEIIIEIMKYLPYADLRNSRLVCKHWYDASQDPRLLAREVIVCDYKNVGILAYALLVMKRPYPHIKFQMIPSSYPDVWDNRELWTFLADHIQTLVLSRCTVSQEHVLRLLSSFSKLRELEIQTFPMGVYRVERPYQVIRSPPPQLPRLKTLRLVDCCLLPIFLATLVEEAPNFSVVVLVDSWMMDVAIDDVSETMQTFSTLLSLMRRNHDRVFQLTLSTSFVLREQNGLQTFLRLVALQNVNLVELRVVNRSDVLVEMVRLGCQKGLSALDISRLRAPCVDDVSNGRVLESISTHFQYLTSLTASTSSFWFSPSGPQTLLSMKDLTTLFLSDCLYLRDCDVWPVFCTQVNLQLKSLGLTQAYKLTPKCIVQLSKRHPALTVLNLDYCMGLNDWSIQAIFHYQVALQSLSVNGCNVTDFGLLGCKLMTPFPICADYGEENPTGNGLMLLTDLRSLCMMACKITDTSLQRAISTLPLLKSLNLSSVLQLTTQGFQCLFRSKPTLEKLVLAGCVRLTDEDVEAMIELRRLTYVDISLKPSLQKADWRLNEPLQKAVTFP